MSYKTKRALHHGTSKVIYEGPASDTLVLHFKDNEEDSPGTGVINNRCSEILMESLSEMGVETHFIRRLNMREQLVRCLSPLPFRFVVHHVAIGEFAHRFSLKEGTCFQEPIIELIYKGQENQETVVSSQHITGLGWIAEDDLDRLYALVGRMGDFLSGYFSARHLKLVKSQFQFGQSSGDQLVLMDEISPRTCCWIEMDTGFYLDAKLKEIPVHQIISDRLSLFPKKDVPHAA